MDQQDCEENVAARWPETRCLVVQDGAAGMEEPGTAADTQEVILTLSPPLRIKAAPSNLRQALPTAFASVKSPPFV